MKIKDPFKDEKLELFNLIKIRESEVVVIICDPSDRNEPYSEF